MNVWCAPAAADASADLRIGWPASILTSQGHPVTVCSLDFRIEARVDTDGHVRDIAPPPCDVLVLQRIQSRSMCEAVPLLQQAGVAVVVEVDDDFGAVDPNNTAWSAVHPKGDPLNNWQWLARACQQADLVTCTTPALATRYGAHGRVAVIPNRLPRQVLTIAHQDPADGTVRVGWAGSIGTHPSDLQQTRGAVGRIMRARPNVGYVNVGPGGSAHALGLADGDETATGWVEPRDWYATIAASIDIAVVPLAPTRFNDAKSGLALLTHASIGVPAVVSPTPDNVRLARKGMGVVAFRPKDWYRHLLRLVDEPGWRAEVAERSKDAARGESLEDHAEGEWLAAWEQARRNRDSAS